MMIRSVSQEQNQPGRELRKQDVLDVALSLFVAQAIGAHPNTCFDNILQMFLHGFPEVCASYGAKLVEGWYVIDLEEEVVVNEHCWCSFPGGRMVDPTVVTLLPLSQPVSYFPGVERCWREVRAIAQKEGAWFPYVRCAGVYGEDGLGHQAYKAAHDAARQKASVLANGKQPPKKTTFLTAQDWPDMTEDPGVCMLPAQLREEEKGR